MRQGPVRGCAGPCVRYFQYRVLCFLCQADSKTAVMAGGYGSAAAVQGRNFLRHKQGSACC